MATKSETVIFNGIKFRRYPGSKRWADRVYYSPGISQRLKGVGRLHVEIWKAHNGPVPEDREIHHADGDPLNNDPSNLVCLTPAEHDEWHRQHQRPMTAERLAHLEAIRPLAAEWHASDAGLEWHREHGKAAFGGHPVRTLTCEKCGKQYQTRKVSRSLFCSLNCRAAARRMARADHEGRACGSCGKAFQVNRYSKTQTCSRSCGAKLRWRGGTA